MAHAARTSRSSTSSKGLGHVQRPGRLSLSDVASHITTTPLLRRNSYGWRLVALLDWDKAWAGPAESDVARMAFWDDMTGPGFWEVNSARTTSTMTPQIRR